MKQIRVKSITAQTITFEVDVPGLNNLCEIVEMPLEDVAKIVDAINKYADISIASRSLEEFMR